jgi:hypothetical protein
VSLTVVEEDWRRSAALVIAFAMREFPLTAIVQRRVPAAGANDRAASLGLHEGTDLLVTLTLQHTGTAKWISVPAVVDTGSPFTIIPRWVVEAAEEAGMRVRQDKHKEPARTFHGEQVLLDRIDNFLPSIVAGPLAGADDATRSAFESFDSLPPTSVRLMPGRMRLLCPPRRSDMREAILGTDMFVNIARFAPVQLAVSWSMNRSGPGRAGVEARGLIGAT